MPDGRVPVHTGDDGDDEDDDDDDDDEDGYIFPRGKILEVAFCGGFGRLLAAAYSSKAL